MSMCRVFSCVVGKGCLLWPVHFLGKTLLVFALLHSAFQGQICLLLHCDPLQYSCLENPMDGGAWLAAVHEVTKSLTRLSDFTFTFHFHALEKKMATHSSILAWRILGTAEPGGLPSMRLHRVRHDWSDLAAAAAVFILEKEVATHSNILAWRILWTEEPGGLLSMGSHRVGHDWSDLAAAAAAAATAAVLNQP